MRTLLYLAAIGGLLASGAARANDRDKALAAIERAIKAHGGEDNLLRAQLMARTATGVMSVGKDLPFAEEMVFQLPNRFRLNLLVGEGAQKSRILLVVNGDKGWQSSGGAVTELGKERLDELLEEAYFYTLTSLVPLKKDSAYELTLLPEAKVAGKPAASVRVVRKGRPEVRLHFDRDSGLLVKAERQARDMGKLIDKQYLFSDHKDFDGVKLAGTQIELHGGHKFLELKVTSYKFPSQVDEKLFGKP